MDYILSGAFQQKLSALNNELVWCLIDAKAPVEQIKEVSMWRSIYAEDARRLIGLTEEDQFYT